MVPPGILLYWERIKYTKGIYSEERVWGGVEMYGGRKNVYKEWGREEEI